MIIAFQSLTMYYIFGILTQAFQVWWWIPPTGHPSCFLDNLGSVWLISKNTFSLQGRVYHSFGIFEWKMKQTTKRNSNLHIFCETPGEVQFHSPEKFSLLSCYAIRRNNLFAETAKLFVDSMPMYIVHWTVLSFIYANKMAAVWTLNARKTRI